MKEIYFTQESDAKFLKRKMPIITLGPEGTSSENTAIDLNKSIHGGGGEVIRHLRIGRRVR